MSLSGAKPLNCFLKVNICKAKKSYAIFVFPVKTVLCDASVILLVHIVMQDFESSAVDCAFVVLEIKNSLSFYG